MEQVKLRNQIEDKYKWDLTPMFASDEKWQEEFDALSAKLPMLDEYAGRLDCEENILACLKLSDELSASYGELYVYAYQRRDEDAGVAKYCAMCDKVDALGVKFGEKSAYITPELTALDGEFLLALSRKEEFADYDYQLCEIVRRKQHTLSAAEEKLLAGVGLFSDGFHDAFNMFDSLDVKFRPVRDEDGRRVEMSHGVYSKLLASSDRKVRKAAFNSMFAAYGDMLHTVGQLYAGNVKKD